MTLSAAYCSSRVGENVVFEPGNSDDCLFVDASTTDDALTVLAMLIRLH